MLILIVLSLFINREDRETELLLKLDNFEMRDPPNRKMVSHFNKMIGITQKRMVVAKDRCNELKVEYMGLVRGEKKKEIKNKTIILKDDDDSISNSYLKDLESDEDEDDDDHDSDDEDDDVIELGNECNVQLDFDGCSSSTTRVSSMNEDVISIN